MALEEKDWELIHPMLKENERLFGISIEEGLLVVEGKQGSPQEVYRKVRPKLAEDIHEDGLEEWVGHET